MVRLLVVAGPYEKLTLQDGAGNVQGEFESISELFRFVGVNFNSYSLEIDSSVVNRY